MYIGGYQYILSYVAAAVLIDRLLARGECKALRTPLPFLNVKPLQLYLDQNRANI